MRCYCIHQDKWTRMKHYQSVITDSPCAAATSEHVQQREKGRRALQHCQMSCPYLVFLKLQTVTLTKGNRQEEEYNNADHLVLIHSHQQSRTLAAVLQLMAVTVCLRQVVVNQTALKCSYIQRMVHWSRKQFPERSTFGMQWSFISRSYGNVINQQQVNYQCVEGMWVGCGYM